MRLIDELTQLQGTAVKARALNDLADLMRARAKVGRVSIMVRAPARASDVLAAWAEAQGLTWRMSVGAVDLVITLIWGAETGKAAPDATINADGALEVTP